jgi:hypothetical protein
MQKGKSRRGKGEGGRGKGEEREPGELRIQASRREPCTLKCGADGERRDICVPR